jgi:hypothetical protein
MTQRETERRQRACDLEERRRAFNLSRPDQILTFRQWCALNAISPRTGARILAGTDGFVIDRCFRS